MVGRDNTVDDKAVQRAIPDFNYDGCMEYGEGSIFLSNWKEPVSCPSIMLGDWKRIMEEEPCIFRGNVLMLEKFDGATPSPALIPSKVMVWIQIHKIPPLFRTEAIINQLAWKVEDVISVDSRVISHGRGDFHRARVNVESKKPLVRFVSLAPEGKDCIFLHIKYAKMPRFCAHCGRMGHVSLECGTGEFSEDDLQYGEWMLAYTETWKARTPRVRPAMDHSKSRGAGGLADRGRTTERSRGRGRGVWTRTPRGGLWKEKNKDENSSGSRKRGSRDDDRDEIAHDKELDDTASSPMKVEKEAGKEVARTEEPKVKKQLNLETGAHSGEGGRVPPPPPVYMSPREKKRAKKLEAHGEEISTSKSVVGSKEESHREQ